MANPQVCPHLTFYAEDAGNYIAEAWQGERFLHGIPHDIRSPMVRVGHRDFYIYEPATMRNNRVCMPIRWFTRANIADPAQQILFADVCRLEIVDADDNRGYVVHEYDTLEIPISQLSLSFIELIETSRVKGLPDPRCILGEFFFACIYTKYTKY
jgi:hypothetical protein